MYCTYLNPRARLGCKGDKILTIACSSERVTKVTVLWVTSGETQEGRKRWRGRKWRREEEWLSLVIKQNILEEFFQRQMCPSWGRDAVATWVGRVLSCQSCPGIIAHLLFPGVNRLIIIWENTFNCSVHYVITKSKKQTNKESTFQYAWKWRTHKQQ